MNDSVKTFIELGQRVDTIGVLTGVKRVAEAKTLRDWTQTDLVLMKDDLIEYLGNIITPKEISVNITIYDAENEIPKTLTIADGSKVSDLMNLVVSKGLVDNRSEIKSVELLTRHGQDIMEESDILQNDGDYQINLDLYDIKYSYMGERSTADFTQSITSKTSIADFYRSASELIDKFDDVEVSGRDPDSEYILHSIDSKYNNIVWQKSGDSFLAKWLAQGMPKMYFSPKSIYETLEEEDIEEGDGLDEEIQESDD